MTFNNFPFYLFLTAVVLINYFLPRRWVWLLISSYVFYGLFDVRFLLVLLACTLITYLTGRLIGASQSEKRKKCWMTVGAAANLSILFLFQYLSFFLNSLNVVLSGLGLRWTLRGMKLIFPLGVSFFVFQTLSYIWDVYDERHEAEKNFGHFALYVAFFPKLLSGPIERFGVFKAQIIEPKALDNQRLTDNLLRIGWGLFKKLVIADRLAVIADMVFAAPYDFAGPKLVVGLLAFTFQIYLDFSAYTDIAISTAALLGFDLVENFDRPYFAKSIMDFWRRWHISLSNWLRDYVFLPLEYRNRRRRPRQLWMIMHLVATFLISGLWHGADWTFIVWGGLHGIYQAGELLTQKARDKWIVKLHINRDSFIHRVFQISLTFGLVCFGWLFFRANSLAEVGRMLWSIVTLEGVKTSDAWQFFDGSLGLDSQDFGLAIGALLLFILVEILQGRHNLRVILKRQSTWLRWLIYYALFFAITIFGFYGDVTGFDFVYFQF